MITKFLVFYCKGMRIGSVPWSEEYLAKAQRDLLLNLIQVDDSGTEHYEVLGVTKEKAT